PTRSSIVWPVGRRPVSSLCRHERFIGPAAEAAESGLSAQALRVAVDAALAFDDPADEQSVELQKRLRSEDAASLAAEVTGLETQHPLFPDVRDAFVARAAELTGSL